MIIYHYHPITGELTGTGKADADPMQKGNWLIPANATTVAPPKIILSDHFAAFKDGIWSQVENHKGKAVYNKETKAAREITEVGPIPDTETELAPSEDDVWAVNGWVLDPEAINRHKERKTAAIRSWRGEQERENLLFDHGGYQWDGGIDSKSRMDETLALSGAIGALPDGFFWTSADDVDIPMELVELESLAEALYAARGLRGFALHARQREMKVEVAALTTIEEVQAYQVGWPEEMPA